MKKAFLLLNCFLLFNGCGYKWSLSQDSKNQISIDIPYVKGDTKGIFTKELIYLLSTQSPYTFSPNGAEYLLEVEFLDNSDSKIGYRRDRDKNTGAVLKNVVPTEGRKTVKVKASISDKEGSIVWGPYEFSCFSDYDYVDQDSLSDLSFINTLGQRQTVLSFSLGQLESIGAAQDASENPLYRSLAQKIIDSITITW